MEPQFYKILVFTIWFILPILPAFILYKFLPNNQVAVSGPFRGLKVDMAGAFAGYFVLFLASYFIIDQMIFEKPVEYEAWTLKGTVFDDRNIPLGKDRNKPDITLYPTINVDNGSLDFPVLVKVSGKHYDFPGINISAFSIDTTGAKLYLPTTFMNDLLDPDVNMGESNGNWQYDFKNKIIKFAKPIIMMKETQTLNPIFTNSILTVDSLPSHQ